MANYTLANFVKAQTRATGTFDQNDQRYRRPATFLEFRRQTEIMIPSHNAVRGRQDRAIEVNYFTRNIKTLGTGGPTHNHTNTKGDSGVLTPTWLTRDTGFSYSLKQANNSIYGLEEELMNEWKGVIGSYAEGLESLAATTLFNARSGVNTYARQGTFNGTQDVFEISKSANGTKAIQIAKTVMDFNKYQGIPMVVFCDTVAYDYFEGLFFQGGGNSENLSFQFGGIRFVKTIDFDALFGGLAAPYTTGAWVVVPEGMLSCLDWIDPLNRAGKETKENVYGAMINPVDGMTYATHMYEERVDATAQNGYVQDVKTEVQVWVDLALEVAPSSTANESPVQAFGFVA